MSLEDTAREFGTPLYVYSRALIEENFRRFDAAFAPVPHLVCYAAKANSNLAVLTLLSRLGSGADVVSGGELRAVLQCGIPADRIVFSGVGKTDDEIEAGVAAGILAFNAESEREIEKIDAIARRGGKVARVALRVNPDIDAKSHPYISTGLKQNKFGVDIGRARQIFEKARGLPGVRMVGIQAHIGSQILEAGPLAATARDLVGAGAGPRRGRVSDRDARHRRRHRDRRGGDVAGSLRRGGPALARRRGPSACSSSPAARSPGPPACC